MHLRLLILSFLIFFFFSLPVLAEETGLVGNLHLGGYLKNETALRFQEPVAFTKIRNILFLEASADPRTNFHLYASFWAWYDAAYLYADYDTINPPNDPNLPLPFLSQRDREDYRYFSELRELYFDLLFPSLDLRVGKQIVVWEQLLGFRIIDEINPLDFREFVLPDLIDFRIPLWTVKADYYFSQYQLEMLWIPFFEPHRPAPPGSEWELFQRLPGQEEPPKTLDNSEYGARLSRTFGGIDLAVSYLNVWDPFPTPFREYTGFRFFAPPSKCLPTEVRFDQPVTDPDCGPVFHPRFNRMHIFGASAVLNMGSYILKGEAAYITGKYFGTRLADRDGDGLLDHGGALERNHIRWGVEVDTILKGADLSFAVSQWIVLGWDEVLFQDNYDTFLSFFGQKSFRSASVKAQFFILYLINNGELLVKPKVSYQISEQFQVAVGADIFYGKKETFLPDIAAPASDRLFKFVSTFVGHDRVFVELKYSF
ncbi:DUF1302 domain-containing protein [Nitrospiraceae bacterium HYJII51-Mn-bac16s-1-B09]|uniref:DUF1302 domain-containing protein n=1 Tax=Candidatus Manganitrophus noduliformans TaxID=2606439 RepID=A0A7X6DPL4_9BACT|nr:DUF1302 domain-containing protein [Candidatus Manganitrophus noduliformans]